jgi:hypothetical protein
MVNIIKLFDDFKNIKYENIKNKTWYESIRTISTLKHGFSVYKKLIKDTYTCDSILLGFYSCEDTEITIIINNNEIKQKIYANQITYPLCNILLTKIGCYSIVNINSNQNIYGIFITITLADFNKMFNYRYFSNFLYNKKKYHLYYQAGNIYYKDNFYNKKFIDELEIPHFTNKNMIWENILNDTPDFNDIIIHNDVLIKLSLEKNIWNKIKNNTDKCREVEKIINDYRTIFDIYNLSDSVVSKFVI